MTDDPEVTQAILSVERAVMAAIRTRDRSALADLLSDRFVLRTPDGAQAGKVAFLESIAGIPGIIASIDGEHVRAFVFGDVAAITGVQVAKVRLPDQPEPVTSRSAFTDLLEREGGRWRLVLAHSVELT